MDVPNRVSASGTVSKDRYWKAHEPWPKSQDQITAPMMGVHVHLNMCFCRLEVFLDSSFAVHWSSCSNAQHKYFSSAAGQKVYSRWSWGPLQPGSLQFYDPRWYLAHSPSPFPMCFSGTELTSIWCRAWQSTQPWHHVTICSSCLITPRYSLGDAACDW